MIRLTRLDNSKFILNCDLIEFIEDAHNTIVCLRTNKKIHVKESIDEVLSKIIGYRQLCFSRPYYSNDEKVYINTSNPDSTDNVSPDNKNDIIDIEEEE